MTRELEYVLNRFNLSGTRPQSPIDLTDMDREDLAELFRDLGYKVGVELGVETGRYSQALLGRNPGLQKLYLVDAWQAYSGYRDHVTQSKVDGLLTMAKDRLKADLHRVRFVRKFSMQAVEDFKDRSLDFVYIDANHGLPWVMDDICAWEKKVRKGGILSGHDYCRRGRGPYQCHVVQAVHAYTDSFFVDPWFVVGRKDVLDGEKRDRPRSWFWVKE